MPAHYSAQDVTLTASLATTPPISFAQFQSGRIINHSGGAVTLTVYEESTAGGEYVKCDDVGTAGALAAIDDNESLRLPPELAGCMFLKFVAASGTPVVRFVFKDGG